MMEYRPLSDTGMQVSAVSLGCWPIAGMTSPGANEADSLAAIRACFELGINHLDTAYMYGRTGESERLIAKALGPRRGEMIVATKGGLHWDARGQQAHDASPRTLVRECEESLRRLATDWIDLYYLHAPDPSVPVAESAAALLSLKEQGKIRAVGVSNATIEQLDAFAVVCPVAAVQPPYNLLKREIEADLLPWCRQRGVAVLVYWPLMKGLFGGKLRREATFENDSRRKYPQFQGAQWERNLAIVQRLGELAAACGHTVAELAVNWAIHRDGITSAICGAKRPEQIRETAAAAGWTLSEQQLSAIEAIVARGDESGGSPA